MAAAIAVLVAEAGPPRAAEGSTAVTAVTRRLEARYRGGRTLKAIFFQSYREANGGAQAESGTAYFERPGRMRWEYESPEPKLFLVDGHNVWFYVPSDHTASRAALKQSEDWRTPLALLTGKANLKRFCANLSLVAPDADSGAVSKASPRDGPVAPPDSVLRCIPRGEKSTGDQTDGQGVGIRDVLFDVDANSWLTRIRIRQTDGAQIEFRFGDWEENIPIAEAKFHFAPPPGVGIVDQQALASQVQ